MRKKLIIKYGLGRVLVLKSSLSLDTRIVFFALVCIARPS